MSETQNRPIGPERILGTMKSQVIHLGDLGIYAITMIDKFGINGSVIRKQEPPADDVEAEMLRQIRRSQVVTRRN